MERMTADRIRMSRKTAEFIRTITAPPFMALLLVSMLYIGLGSEAFVSPLHYIEAIFTLTLLPLLAYLPCRMIPSLKSKGRKLERNLALVFSVLGYVLGAVFALFGGGTRIEIILYLTYLISGMLTALTTIFGFKASGHTCGTSGPAALLVYCMGSSYALMFALLIPVYASSIKLKRHTLPQLIAGTIVPVVALMAAIMIAGAIV